MLELIHTPVIITGVWVGIIGLIVGSFLSALTYRIPRGISIGKGRSFCPNCKHQIAWFDNIPLISYLLLSGRCRSCKKAISLRYPLIEAATLVLFLLLYFTKANFLLFPIATLLIAIFVVDSEHQIIPDELIFWGMGLVLTIFIVNDFHGIYTHLLAGMVVAVILLMIHFITRGRGMGLGDVKFAILGGLILGFPLAITWLFVSFITGGIVASVLLVIGNAKLKDKIAFGPFLVIGMFIILFVYNRLWG